MTDLEAFEGITSNIRVKVFGLPRIIFISLFKLFHRTSLYFHALSKLIMKDIFLIITRIIYVVERENPMKIFLKSCLWY